MGNEILELAKVQMKGAIDASSGPIRMMYEHELMIIESLGQMVGEIENQGKYIQGLEKRQETMIELCDLLTQKIINLEKRIAALENKPVKKGLF